MKPTNPQVAGAQSRQSATNGKKKSGPKSQFLGMNKGKGSETNTGELAEKGKGTIPPSPLLGKNRANAHPGVTGSGNAAASQMNGQQTPVMQRQSSQRPNPSGFQNNAGGEKAPSARRITIPLSNAIEQAPTIELPQINTPPPTPIVAPMSAIESADTMALPPMTRPQQPPMSMGGPLSTPGIPFPQQAPAMPTRNKINRNRALIFIALLSVMVIQGMTLGPKHFLGKHGWSFVLGGSQNQSTDLLGNGPGTNPGSNTTAQPNITPEQYIDGIVSRMTLDQKLGQMMMVQFEGANYPENLDEMISQYYVGAAFLLNSNSNITENGTLLKALTKDMQDNSKAHNSQLPMLIAVDQEGGNVDRMSVLQEESPSAASIGDTGDPNQAKEAGKKDATTLNEYGINLNLAPVVDVNILSYAAMNEQGRTYSSDPAVVAQMAEAYLEGLQQTGKVLGTLKHFPGIGGIAGDPHYVRTNLDLDKEELYENDWAPYRDLIEQGNTHAIMVTHTYVNEIDPDLPASLSPKVMKILREEMGFKGVIMTDSLSMAGVGIYASEAAALAIEAGSDMIMGAKNAYEVGEMIDAIKEKITSGEITEQQINESASRILMLKHKTGQLPITQTS